MALRRVLFAPFGYALRAVARFAAARRGDRAADRAVRLAAFALAGAAAGLAGGLSAFSKGSVFPSYDLHRPLGRCAADGAARRGADDQPAPIVGALAYTGLYDTLLQATDWWRLVLGAAIVALVLAFPQGIAGAAQRAWRGRWRRERAGSRGSAERVSGGVPAVRGVSFAVERARCWR